MKPITARQLGTLEFIKKFIAEKGYSPSMREIGDGLSSASPSTILELLNQLESKGFITRAPGQTRSIKVVEQGELFGDAEKLAIAVKALEWYAERKHWIPTVEEWPETDRDGGQLAITALKEIGAIK